MATVFSGDVDIDYGQIYVMDQTTVWTDPIGTLGGQHNGLCGAGWPGALVLITGTHTGRVSFVVEVMEVVPPVEDGWEDIVEVSYVPNSAEVALIEWGGVDAYPIPLIPGASYRVRYCANGMDAARDEYPEYGEVASDRYRLSFWPAPPAPDAVVKKTSAYADYWHRSAAEMPVPPSPQQLLEDERQRQEEMNRAAMAVQLLAEWGGRMPTERQLQSAMSHIVVMAGLDRDLTDQVSAADPMVQRSVARWAVRRAFEAAGLAELDWVAPALAAMDAGVPLPPPFEPLEQWTPGRPDMFQWMRDDPNVVLTTVNAYDGGPLRHSRQHMALPALPAAVDEDPLKAAMNALFAAAVSFGDEYPSLFAELRAVLPTFG